MARTVARAAGWFLAVELVALVGTGAWLAWAYQPSSTVLWVETTDGTGAVEVVRAIHRLASVTLLPTVAVVVVSVLVDRSARRPRWWVAPWALAAALATVVASASGYGLAWDSLSLWDVPTDAASLGGIRWLADDQVRFVLVGGSEVSLGIYRGVVALHLVATASLAALAWWASRRRLRRPGA